MAVHDGREDDLPGPEESGGGTARSLKALFADGRVGNEFSLSNMEFNDTVTTFNSLSDEEIKKMEMELRRHGYLKEGSPADMEAVSAAYR